MAGENNRGLGLLPKLILGVFVPVMVAFLIIGSMLFLSVNVGPYQFRSIKDLGFDSLQELTASSVKESTEALNKLGERLIREKAEDVAKQIEIYVRAKPAVLKAGVERDQTLREIAVQKVGETGYTAVHDTRGINHFHSNPQVVGTDLKQLSGRLPQFWKIIETGLGKVSFGYYDWKDADGRVRPKYMYTAPVKGTNLIVAATTYIDEFSKPAQAITGRMNKIEKTYARAYENRFRVFYLIILVDLIVLLLVLYIYSYSIVKPIRYLSEVADKISMGDLKTTISIKARGEVAVLAESIERMRTSVKAAIERLQRRREENSSSSAKP